MKKIILVLLCLLGSNVLLAQENQGGKISGYMCGDYFYYAVIDTGCS